MKKNYTLGNKTHLYFAYLCVLANEAHHHIKIMKVKRFYLHNNPVVSEAILGQETKPAGQHWPISSESVLMDTRDINLL